METLQKKSPGGGNRNGTIKNHSCQFSNIMLTEQDIILVFKAALDKAGLSTKDKIIADGQLSRFHVEGDKAGSKNGWYVLFCDGIPAGCFGSWKTSDIIKWCIKSDRKLTQEQRKQNHSRMVEAQKVRKTEEVKRRKFAKRKALSIWKSSSTAPYNHPYLLKKSVKMHGLRLYKKSLVVPIRDINGDLHSLQFIDNVGNKRFLSGGRKKGCYFAIGTPLDTLCIAEGYATAASIYQVTGHACAVALDAGNLKPVAIALRNKFPNLKIIICADNDINTDGNPGVTKAKTAALSVGASLVIPPNAGDFNDLLKGGAV